MKYKTSRGFTLIELLVVIAIIGVLSAVVLASLNTARSKGNDAGVKANLSTVKTQAALFLSDNSNAYGVFNNGSGAPATCPVSGTAGATVFHNATIENAIAAAKVDSSGGATACYSTNTEYAVVVARPADVAAQTSTYWCVDSSGVSCGVNSLTLSSPGAPSCGTCASTQ
ncbi:MAG: prepilin-type N-terminal cleavage/methylation domain-containing protein [Parcubacteria group bacterium Gr01-1014_49]|nr:MAG: prepilin-type N-terminal cleavage/methylation domain-containing protein [Parcubacteria group bacterium Gr01-1014_49]